MVDDELGAAWRAARLAPSVVHLDSAACSRPSRDVLDAVAAHARAESVDGGYVAQTAVAGRLDGCRADLAGLLGTEPDGVAFVESATAALDALLRSWPLAADDVVAVLPGEYGPNLAAFHRRGLAVRSLPVDGLGRADPDALARELRRDAPPTLVHLTQVASHRGIAQPAAALVDVCHAAGVPVVVDAAQALGHVDAASGADAVYATSRKWLAGPRGVGILAVRPNLSAQLTAAQLLSAQLTDAKLTAAQLLESAEGHVAGRMGLAVAVREHLATGPGRVRMQLAALGRATRERCDGVSGWQVVEPLDEATAVTTLRPPAGLDVTVVRVRLLAEHGVLTTYAGPERAPGDAAALPVLRVSPHLDATEQDLAALVTGLRAVSAG